LKDLGGSEWKDKICEKRFECHNAEWTQIINQNNAAYEDEFFDPDPV
jgi:hypothetical protein